MEHKRKHVNVSGNVTVMIETQNITVELAVQIGELQKEASSLRAGQRGAAHIPAVGTAIAGL